MGRLGLAPQTKWGANKKRKVFMRIGKRFVLFLPTSSDFASVHERSTHGMRSVASAASCVQVVVQHEVQSPDRSEREGEALPAFHFGARRECARA